MMPSIHQAKLDILRLKIGEVPLTSWQLFYDEITSADGLSLDRWLKNSSGYLPDYLDTKEQKFGHARIGNYDQVMIYQFTGWNDPSRKDKYTNIYKKNILIENKSDLQSDYGSKIK